ncbi:MAG: hypothetical protein JWM76_4116 [Pseudonocardiales bacterium]|nr:hypothetical protein [Pseudonocardiales bacterium]
MKLRRSLTSIAAVSAVAILALTGCSASSDSDDAGSDTASLGTLVFATTGNAAPYTLTEDDGTLDGYDIELCTTIAEALGYEVDFEAVDFSATIAGVEAGRFDGVCTGTTATDERKASTTFMLTEPTSTDGLTALVRADDDAFTTIDSLKEATFGRVAGSVEAENLGTYLGVDMTTGTEYPGFAQAIIDLTNDRIDAIPIGGSVAGYYATEDETLSFIEPFVDPHDNAVILKNDEDLLDGFNEQIEAMRADGSLDALQEKWFGTATAPVSE